MVKYHKYAEYKDSGVEWVDTLPIHWSSVHLKWISIIYAGGTPSKTIESYWENGVIPWINSGAVNQTYILEPYTYITKAAYENSSAKWIPKNALVMALAGQGKTKGMVAQLGIDTTCNQSMAAILPNDLSYARYLFWWITANYQNIRNMSGGDLRDGLNLEHLGDIGCPLPSSEEVTTIANFLDYETAQIDILITKQEKLIELLKEKRQAVISHAVTKGLNPNAPMKDSDVEWLGEVPEHWEVRQLRYLGTCQNGINIGAEYFGSGSPFISYGDVYRNPELPSKFEGLVQSTENDRKIYSLKRGDVLFTRTSETIEEIGFSSTCLTDVENATFAGFLIRFRPLEAKLLPEYSKFYFRNLLLRAFFVKEMNLVTRASLSQELLKKLPVMLPSIEEQERISDFLRDKDQVFERLINRSNEQIILLKERRTALISAAVTGKIDIRNWQHPNQKNKADVELSA
ncbi:restriction endonuclease subunit S [Acinetobacter bereziniae]|uniref:restriction endonuclease subunit S n=1 Tax=Acinetobacter bereziniae TaxID=106648 RepID=UPI0019013673|nr:restriction endonuclease subunit S [Acinetobacter bereziniae]MBJ8442566.1 restriction endonuclease subunit S [Acinetobacter bereziniae]